MRTYIKMLIGFYNDELNSYANKGDWLYCAQKTDSKKGLKRMPKGYHFFVSLNEERTPSEIGVVKRLSTPITAKELAILDYKSRGKSVEDIPGSELLQYDKFLRTINSYFEHTPVAVDWSDQLTNDMKKEKYLWIHKVLFRDWSKEKKKEVFEWDF
ncbi:hypothetical protein [Shouchella hunanensis]|uniref:Uncharacterized protein n=1 Tax=Shouchella hunanensis TaxID=766894 RepID=A0ABY7W099_9BACI|nr:hypothetical protein [Shouchella hunanensis]WDF02378.1 hypothetical protein PQ477_12685 [Shouchella hunanensis]